MTKFAETQTIILSAGAKGGQHRHAAAKWVGWRCGENGGQQDDRTWLAAESRRQPTTYAGMSRFGEKPVTGTASLWW